MIIRTCVSLSEKCFGELEKYKKEFNYSTKSELVRAAIRSFVSKLKLLNEKRNAVVILKKIDGEVNVEKLMNNPLVSSVVFEKIEENGKKKDVVIILLRDARDRDNLSKILSAAKYADFEVVWL